MYILTFVMRKFYRLEMLSCHDELFFVGDDRNEPTLVSFARCKKIENVDELRKTVARRACQFSRLKSRVKKVCGAICLEEQSEDEVMNSIDTFMPLVDGIHDEKALAQFMADEKVRILPSNGLQWRFYIIPNYSEEESVIVFKFNHCLADGVAIVMMLCHLTDSPSVSHYPTVCKPLSIC